MRNTVLATLYTISLFVLTAPVSADGTAQAQVDAHYALQATQIIVHEDLAINTRDLFEFDMAPHAAFAARLEMDAAFALESARELVLTELAYQTARLTWIDERLATATPLIGLVDINLFSDSSLAPTDLLAAIAAE